MRNALAASGRES